MNYVDIAVPFFVLAMGIEFLYGWLVKKQTYRVNDTINSLQLGTLSTLNKVLRLGISAAVLGGLAKWIGVPLWPMSAPWQWALAFVAYDFCYYWKHRYGHECRIFWASHVAHHQSEEFNLSTALRQTGTDYIGFVFYLPLYLVGVPAAAMITVGSLNLIYQFWVHTEHIRRLGPIEWIFVTPSNHRVHHARNTAYLDKNYGGVFILWDRIFGTFKDERADEPCVYGITSGLKSWNPLWANFHFWYDTAKLAWRTHNWGDKFRIWFKAPAWLPADLDDHKQTDWRYPKFDPQPSTFVKVYVFVQYWLLLAAALWLQATETRLPRAFVLLMFAWICFAFFVQGIWLEARTYAKRFEWMRVVSALLLAFVAYTLWPQSLINAAAILGSYAFLSALAVGVESMWSMRKLASA
jgi:sterol desaturase/sphingolipid hydroxylase (fatty acid hydroxylase superfamily)